MPVDEVGQTVTDGAPAKPKPKGKVSPARNVIGIVLLIGFSGAAIFEVMANRSYTGAVKRLEARIPNDETDPNSKNGTLPSRDETEKLIGKAPDGPLVLEGREQKAVYTWQGLRRKYRLKVFYTNQKNQSLIRVETE
jgi:hypothetical protein